MDWATVALLLSACAIGGAFAGVALIDPAALGRFGRRPRHRLVVIESPYAGSTTDNMAYLNRAILDCLRRGESPYASHRMLTDALRDAVPEERELGISAGFAFRERVHATVVYMDRGISGGMWRGIADARAKGLRVEYRKMDDDGTPAIWSDHEAFMRLGSRRQAGVS